MSDKALNELFIKELGAQVLKLRAPRNSDTFYITIHSVRGGLKILGFDALTPLFTTVEKLITKKVIIPKEIEEEIIALLERLAKTTVETLESSIANEAIEGAKILKSIESLQPSKEEAIDSNLLLLFKDELETKIPLLTNELIQVEGAESFHPGFETLMRAAHSIKGSAKVVMLEPIIALAHVMEDCFEEAKEGHLIFDEGLINLLLRGVDYLSALAKVPLKEIKLWIETYSNPIIEISKELKNALEGQKPNITSEHLPPLTEKSLQEKVSKAIGKGDRFLKVTSDHLDHLMGLAGESMVDSAWLQPFTNSLSHLKLSQDQLSTQLDQLREAIHEKQSKDKLEHLLSTLTQNLNDSKKLFAKNLSDLELFVQRNSTLSDRFYQEVINIRMRPFSDLSQGLPRLCRAISKELGKKVQLVIKGNNTQIDRELIERLESPLNHLIRNAIDHGIESEGIVTIEAFQKAGMLNILVSDEGRGVNLKKIREDIIAKKLASKEQCEDFSNEEVLEFLFFPGFTTKERVTETSGRGFGLDIVKTAVTQVAGTVKIETKEGKGMTVILQLPLTLSLIRSLIVLIGGEPYAFALSKIESTLNLDRMQVHIVENHPFFELEGKNVALVDAMEILELGTASLKQAQNVVVLSHHNQYYGLIVDSFLGEKELVIQEIDPRLGGVPNILAGAFLEDGSPLLIFDTDELLRSMDIYFALGYKR